MRLLLATIVTCYLLAAATGRLRAQSTFGEILGTVHDSSGAVVQGVQVTLANTGTTPRVQRSPTRMETTASKTSMWEPTR